MKVPFLDLEHLLNHQNQDPKYASLEVLQTKEELSARRVAKI